MYEVEFKVPISHDTVRNHLQEAGFIYEETVIHRDRYFQAPHRDFAQTDEALRIRVTENAATLTYKGAIVDGTSKTRQEYEVAIDDATAATAIFEAIGFETVATVEKERAIYRRGETEVVLDTVSGIGEYLEIERKAEETELEEARTACLSVLESLDIDVDRCIKTSYLELVLDNQRA